MIKQSFSPYSQATKRLMVAIIIGVVVELIYSIYIAFTFNDNTVMHLRSMYSYNQGFMSDWLNGLFNYIKEGFDSIWKWFDIGYKYLFMGLNFITSYFGIKLQYHSAELFRAIYLSFLIYMQKVIIAFASMINYFIIVLVFLFDGVIARELRRYNGAPESINQNWTSLTTFGENLMYTGYIAFPFIADVFSPAVWFLSISFCLCWLYRRQVEYIQKYL